MLINRKGMMPIDSQLQASPPSAGDAGSSRRSNERRNSGRLKPQKSVEDDVFDNHWDSPNSDAPANEKAKKIAKRQQATQKAKAVTKQYLAPASSPPVDEFLKRTNSIIALEEAIEDAIQEESEADGDPDTDDAELENDLHRNIKRNQGQVDRTEVNRDSSDIHPGRTRNDTQATGMTLSTPPISQVPDTQAPITHPSEGDVTQLMRTRNRVQREHITDLPVTMTGRIHLDSVQIQGLPVTVHAALGQVQPLTVNPSKAVGSIALASSINPNGQDGKERTTAQGQGSVDEQTVRAHVALNSVSSVQARNAHAQTEEEKRDELKRIVVGLVQEYDLNYTAVHRLIQECRKRYQHVNQTLLRGMIEQALAASAQE
ncbi:hypothetical protein QFC19_002717 [Naganishia cerealis]|uniref:Uncharacterized protein n=1 Tax=Naganishia cerealis TaxID=610337 RepID=A0ACC2W8R1_9TREE|nr:hypothetical protein QFC19_002717 [Naganishia cerealis]